MMRSSGDERTVRGLCQITEKEKLSLSNHWMFPAKGHAVHSCLSGFHYSVNRGYRHHKGSRSP